MKQIKKQHDFIESRRLQVLKAETERVVRSRSFTPNWDSRLLSRRVNAGEVTARLSAARAKLLSVAMVTKACIPSTSIFIREMQQLVR